MVSYDRRACSKCGIREPQPDMHQFEVTSIGVHGNYLAPRMRWFCELCVQPYLRSIAQAETRHAERLANAAAEKVEYKEKKRLWEAEQERRRLANLTKRSDP